MDLKIGTWNVQTMLQAGKMEELARDLGRFKIQLAALQEIRWKSSGVIDKKEYSFYFSTCEERRVQYGPGFMVSKKIRKAILGFDPIS